MEFKLTRDYFFFGSLRDRDILLAVSGQGARHLAFRDGRLSDHALHRVAQENYPLLVESPGESVPGLIVSGLTTPEIERISFFEDSYYRPRPLDIVTADGVQKCHVFGSEDLSEDSGEAWSFEAWSPEERAVFRLVTEAFMSRYGTASFDEVDADWEHFVAQAELEIYGRHRIG